MYKINSDVVVENEGKLIRIDGIELSFTEDITQFVDNMNNTLKKSRLSEDTKLLCQLIDSGIITIENVDHFPKHIVNTFFCLELNNLRLDILSNKRKIGIFSVPYFEGSKIPMHIESIEKMKKESQKIPNINFFASNTKCSNIDVSDYGTLNFIKGESLKKLEYFSKSIMRSKILPIFVGGDHSITYSIIKGLFENSIEKIRILKFDSHSDFGDFGDFIHHGNVFNWLEKDFPLEIVNFGNYTPMVEEEAEYVSKKSISFSDIKKLIGYLKENKMKTYISFDIDVLNSNIMGGVSYPNPQGINLSCISYFIKHYLRESNEVIGMDFVEYNSFFDNNNTYAYTSAYVLYMILDGLRQNEVT
ncbi:agmatinase [Enterococcus sp. 12C11_DIV0727]|uniref:Agmatinase n=2 Tax=Candidatus Enterococcus lemimoniae TaxID=1834167 RepID=A0ABZ2TBS7_9ENTE